ncbi:transmembrane protein, putative (macronuclear) [Tetrahymena thermophila SB210]|uniref:Transmembrane protein, putative n=1 Tax=Tetrahymena thermophila (strain SB210) TaxID=312017 RepID=Q23MH4_TETTS|nr:transmembrane protein, putative [Tetrahymena thermophila SB210]EAR97665.3 transmembrane protein, putative [Tetrahymena thermophila SB210]|eukprot:XP_001017910.3 transmembrane protein, putative [Tetrahymena thermophila SB210]
MNYELQKNDTQPISSNQDQSAIQNENQNSEDFQQIHNEDVMNAQQSQEKAKNETDFDSHNSESNSQKDSQKVQDPQNSNEEQQKSNNEERKLNALYFIGVNSLVMNVLFSHKLSFLNNICVQVLVIALANAVTYISLYKCKETKQLFKKVKQSSSSLSQKARNKITKKRLLVSFGSLLCLILIAITIFQIIRVQQLQKNFNNLKADVTDNYYKINSLYQYRESDYMRFNQHQFDIQKQEQINIQLGNQLRQLEILAQRQSQEIEQLKLKLTDQQRQQIFQNDQINKQKQESQQTQQQSQQQSTQSKQQYSNQRQEQERPEYPKIKQPIREQVRCSSTFL